MGKHKTQRKKLQGLRQRLLNDETIPNREIRAAFGKRNYKIYAEMLKQAKAENDEGNRRERTAAQKKTERLIKQALMLGGRGADSTVWIEKASEALGELTEIERAEMNYWERHSETGTTEFVWPAGDDTTAIYKDFLVGVSDIKQGALVGALDEILGGEEMDEAAKEQIRQRLKRLRTSLVD